MDSLRDYISFVKKRDLLLEIEEPLSPNGQLATRLETFVSTL